MKSEEYASGSSLNVVANGTAKKIVLHDAPNGNNFYCPQAFKAQHISYVHNYSMRSGYRECRGWETIVLPFDVTSVVNQTGTELIPRSEWTMDSSKRPFFLYGLTDGEWQPQTGIKANTPYLISMPNNSNYAQTYCLTGDIEFRGTNVQVLASDNLQAVDYGKKVFVPTYQYQVASSNIYPLNVNNQLAEYTGESPVEGSAFIRNLRPVHPFETYLTMEGSDAVREVIPLFEEEGTSGIGSIPLSGRQITERAVYNIQGQQLSAPKRGLNIVGGRKIVVR